MRMALILLLVIWRIRCRGRWCRAGLILFGLIAVILCDLCSRLALLAGVLVRLTLWLMRCWLIW